MNKLQFSRILMVATILLLAAFEGYWLNKLYQDEYKGLSNGVEVAFRGTIDRLQRRLYEKDTLLTAMTMLDTGRAIRSVSRREPVTKRSKKIQDPKNTSFFFKYVDPVILKNVNPHEIESVVVKQGEIFRGVPPPGLIEMMLKKRAGYGDSTGRIIISNDEPFQHDSATLDRVRKMMPSVTIRLKKNPDDSLLQPLLRDSLVKLSGVRLQKDTTREKDRVITIRNFSTARMHTDNMLQVTTSVREPAIVQDKLPLQIKTSPIVDFFKSSKTLNDSIPVKRVDSAYKAELTKVMNGYPPYQILFRSYNGSPLKKADFEKDSTKEVTTSKVFVGFNTPYSYQAHFSGVKTYILKKMRMQIGGSALLLLLVVVSFVIVYRNLLAQQKLAGIKNDFISNITHELKTPIATVTVAIEALRNFNAIQSPERTKEYLDISASELQRLSLLVDKVLKLSMFESKKVELKKEAFDMKVLVEETINTMRLQFEKQAAQVSFDTEGGPFIIEADKLHITSVIYNLLDNALKYSKETPVIQVNLTATRENIIELKVSDNGVGIAHQYQAKVFDKFFRVPMGNQHNIKGYGLGLSYVAEIVKRHMGYIYVESVLGKGSAFIVKLPVKEADEIRFDERRVIRKKRI